MSWWELVVLLLLSALLLAPLVAGFALGSQRRSAPLGRLDRVALWIVLVERVGLVVALWIATFDRSLWILVGVVMFVVMSRLFLRGVGRRIDRPDA
jgi:hypothetical protein